MANNKKSRSKTGNAKKSVKKSGRAASVPSTSTRTGRGSKTGTKSKAQGKRGGKTRTPARLGEQVGAPPTDMTPPHIEDTRPVHAPSPNEPVHAPQPDVAPSTDLRGVTPTQTEASRRAKTEGEIAGSGPATGPLLQGASCTWIGRASQANEDMATRQLLCPHCSGRLIQLSGDERTLQLGFEAWELGAYPSADHAHPPRPHPGYRGLVTWMRGQTACWPTIEQAAGAYFKATGNNVDPSL